MAKRLDLVFEAGDLGVARVGDLACGTRLGKALLDRGYHAPTVYFPLIVPECLMIEPTETESKETLDAFIAAFREIVAAARIDPESALGTPRTTPVGRIDETRAARQPDLRWRAPSTESG